MGVKGWFIRFSASGELGHRKFVFPARGNSVTVSSCFPLAGNSVTLGSFWLPFICSDCLPNSEGTFASAVMFVFYLIEWDIWLQLAFLFINTNTIIKGDVNY